MKSSLSRLLIVIFASLGVITQGNARNVFFRNLSEVGQLGDMTVSSIVRDSLGYVWLGTRQGVERFDGMRLDNFPLPSLNGRPGAVTALKPLNDPSGRIIAGKDDGLWLVDPVTGNATHLDGNDLNGVSSIVSFSGDTIMVGCSEGLFLLSVTSNEVIPVPLPLPAGHSRKVVDISRGDGSIWIATDRSIFRLSNSSRQPLADPFDIDGSIRQIKTLGDKIFVGTHDRGLLVIDRDSGHNHRLDIGCNVITALEERRDGMLYVGTDGAGIIVIDPEAEKTVDRLTHSNSDAHSLHSNSIYSLHVDRMGLVWAGFYQLGADYTLYQTPLFEVFDEPYFNSLGVNVRVVAIDGDMIVLGTRDGLDIINRSTHSVRHIAHPLLRSNLVISLLLSDGLVYVGTFGGGLSVVDPATGRVSQLSDTPPFTDGHIFSIVRNDSTGDVWFGTSMGLYRRQPSGEFTRYHYGNSHLPDGNVYGIFFDSLGRGWMMTATGLAIWDPFRETLRTDIFPPGFFRHDDIRAIYETPDNTLYFLPDKGLPHYSDLQMKNFGNFGAGILDGLDVKAVTSDTNNSLWLATNNGIFLRDSLDRWQEYSFIDGIPSPIFNNTRPITDADGNIWIGNTKGLLRLDWQQAYSISEDSLTRPVVTGVIVKGEPMSLPVSRNPDNVIPLPKGVRDFDLTVSTFSYTSPESMVFDYLMEGVDTDWHTSDNHGVISYYDLRPGHYRLTVRNAKRPQSATGVTIEVTGRSLSPALTVTIAILLLGAATAWVLLRRHRRLATRRARELEMKRHQYIGGTTPDGADRVKYKTNRLSIAECEAISSQLDTIMCQTKPYVNPDLTLAELAGMIDISAHKLSYYFSQYLHQSYYDYINTFRVNEFKRMASGDEAGRFTLTALSVKAGFSSRASFFRYFKKSEGITPAQYMKDRTN